MKKTYDHNWFIIFFSFTIFAFLYPLIFMRGSFLAGDSFVQFYPWMKLYSEAVKNFTFPFWVSQMQSGFPLMAEGQIGGFYPLNIVMFFILPFKIAYNYSIIIHFIIGGIFTYFYSRKMGADQMGGYLSALLFCFGSAYSGCFYNIVTLRTLAWFPTVMFLFEKYFKSKKVKFIIFSGVILGFQMLAGFIQLAVYSAIFYIVYLLYRGRSKGITIGRVLFNMAIIFLIAFLVSLPQLLLTFKLAGFSGREGLNLNFALWRSFFPLGILGLIFPYPFSFTGSNLYVGIFSIFFVLFCFARSKKEPDLKVIIVMFFLSLFLALGKYNPFYVIILKMFKLYGFRNPSKFLFFGAFALSVLAGCGFTKYFEQSLKNNGEKVQNVFSRLLMSLVIFMFLVNLVLYFFKDRIMVIGDMYIKKFVYDQPYHRYSFEYYSGKLASIINTITNSININNLFVCFFLLSTLCAIIFLPKLLKRKLRFTIIGIIFLDLLVFSIYGVGFRGNLKTFNWLVPDNKSIFLKLKEDKDLFRILPFDIDSGELPNWSLPNANIIYGVDSVAAYSPLAVKAYKDSLSGLEIVDDSLGLIPPRQDSIASYLEKLRLLNVKYILSKDVLNYNFLSLIEKDNKVFLYQLKDSLPRVFFCTNINSEIKDEKAEGLNIVEYRNGFLRAKIKTSKEGFLVFSENYYPGWKVFVDKEEEQIARIGDIVLGVGLKKGEHEVIFKFNPFVLNSGESNVKS